MLDIKPMYLKGLACYEGALVTIAYSLKREYQLSFSDTFCFSYLKDSIPFVGEKIVTSNDAFQERIKYYCGVYIHAVEIMSNINDTTKYMINNNLPVGVETNAYYCPWSFEYKKSNYGHHYLIIGYDKNGYQCIDTTMYEKVYTIDYENFQLGTNRIVGFNYDSITKVFDYRELLKKSVCTALASDCLNDLNSFYNDFVNIDYEGEFSQFDGSHWGCALQRNIGFYLVGSIELYLVFIKYMTSKISCAYFSQLIDFLQDLKDQWSSLYGIILKIYYTKDPKKYMERSLRIVKKIISLHEIIFDCFEKIKKCL